MLGLIFGLIVPVEECRTLTRPIGRDGAEFTLLQLGQQRIHEVIVRHFVQVLIRSGEFRR